MSPLSSEIIAKADLLYARREQIENVRESVGLLRDAAKSKSDFELSWRLSRSLFFLGQEATDSSAAYGFHSEGIKFGQLAVRKTDEKVEGHFWLGVNLALGAEGKRLRALPKIIRARRELQRAVEIDEAYHCAGPLRVLARLAHKTPRALGGNKLRAESYYKRAIAIAPQNTVTRIYFAELLLELGERTLAREQLEYVLNTPLDPGWAFEIARDRQLAKEMCESRKRETEPYLQNRER